MGWSYGLGRYNGKIKLCIISIDIDSGEVWGYKESWMELFRNPKILLRDLFDQWRNLESLLDINKLEKRMSNYFKKIIDGECSKLE